MDEQLYRVDHDLEERNLWVAGAAVMELCFDGRTEHSTDGRVYPSHGPPKDLYRLDGLLVCMDAVMDEIGGPRRWGELRTTVFRRKRQKPVPAATGNSMKGVE